jgi:hypothetical protein
MDISRALERIKTWHIFVIAVLFSEILTFFLNSFQSILRWGRISIELLEIGAIDAVVVSLIVATMVVFLLRSSAKIVLEKKGCFLPQVGKPTLVKSSFPVSMYIIVLRFLNVRYPRALALAA